MRRARAVIPLFALALTAASAQPQPPFAAADDSASPRIAQLRKAVEAGDRGAIEQFWVEMAANQTPLVEPVPDRPHYSWVTFVWRGDADTKNVAIIDGVASGIGGVEPSKMLTTQLLDTGVWYRTYLVRNDARFHYWFSPNDDLKPLLDPNRHSKSKPDPLNPRLLYPTGPSYVELSETSRASFTPVPGSPKGTVAKLKYKSGLLNNERDVWVYTPPGFDPKGDPYPLLLVFDGGTYSAFAPAVLDNLIAAKKIAPPVAVMIGSASPPGREAELECSNQFADFLAAELVPWARKNYRVTSDPAQTIVAGSSLGGLAATFAGFRHPEVFGKVFSQSGSFWWRPDGDAEPEWLARQFAAAPKLRLDVLLQVGLMEVPEQLGTSRHLRDVLTAKGYTVAFQGANGNHSAVLWRGIFADGIAELLGTREPRF